MSPERRKSNRIAVDRDYYLIPGDEKTRHRCTVKNISVTGACITSTRLLAPEDIIYLHITGPRDSVVKSEVVWNSGGMYGILFLLDTPSDFDTISFIMNNLSSAINKPGE
ncbi:MAG: PilZ domain-containing protein [Spirochaetes bacterium]|nr:PilZ domain-containing protein [Spirochaetota bacterium]